MRKKESYRMQAKRAVVTGLFLGVVWGLNGCVEPVVQPGVTNTPIPVITSGTVPTPVPETPTPMPEITESPETPTSEPVDMPSGIPAVSQEPTVAPTQEPQSTVTAPVVPSDTPTPEPSSEPSATLTPDLLPEATPIPTPLPTGQPAYDTLLQNGWQRTEDFFGCREIFFSGQFDKTELIVVPGRYEYRYTASSDAGISFSVIGEEHLPVQSYLDELVKGTTECQIETEGEEDYRYTYTDSERRVNGRVYACGDGETSHRMRVEFCSPLVSETQTEGYGFYLRETIKGE